MGGEAHKQTQSLPHQLTTARRPGGQKAEDATSQKWLIALRLREIDVNLLSFPPNLALFNHLLPASTSTVAHRCCLLGHAPHPLSEVLLPLHHPHQTGRVELLASVL